MFNMYEVRVKCVNISGHNQKGQCNVIELATTRCRLLNVQARCCPKAIAGLQCHLAPTHHPYSSVRRLMCNKRHTQALRVQEAPATELQHGHSCYTTCRMTIWRSKLSVQQPKTNACSESYAMCAVRMRPADSPVLAPSPAVAPMQPATASQVIMQPQPQSALVPSVHV